jgi:hypothetical protein
VAIPRAKDILHLMLVTPEVHCESAEEVFEALLKTLEVTGTQIEGQEQGTCSRPARD